MPFELIPEMTDSRRIRPGRRIPQGTNGIPFNPALDIPQQIDIAHFTLTIFDVLQDLLHPARSFTAGGALSTALMTVEPRQRQRMPHHTLVFIQHDKTTATHHGPFRESAVSKALIVHHTRLPL